MSDTISGLTGAGGGDLMRITGMATGLDVDGMVKKMMAAEQIKVDKVKQQQQLIKWRQEAYQDIIKDFKDLQSSFFDSANADKNILSPSNYSGFDVSGGSPAVVNITAGIGAQTGNYKVNVAKLATGAGVSNTLSNKLLSTKLTDIDPSLNGDIKLVLNANGAEKTISLDNSEGKATLGDLVSAINNQGGGSVKTRFRELTGEFSLVTSATGKDANLTFKTGTTAKLSKVLGSFTEGTKITNGENADVTITPPGATTGVQVTDKTNNNFTIDGMNYSLAGVGESTVSVGANPQKVCDKIKGFVDKYNAIVDKIQTKLSEKKEYKYKPLTDAQRSSMKEDEIKAWEAKAKVGVLKNDDNLKNMLSSLREAFTTGVDNTSISIGRYSSNNFGIDTSKDCKKPGHIEIVDESKLKEVIASKGDQILKIFTNKSSSTDKKTAFKENGIFTRMKSILEDNVGFTNTTLNNAILTSYSNKQEDFSISGSAGKNSIPDQLHRKDVLIKKMTKLMIAKQEKYYQQFARLETAMNQLNSQQSWLAQQFGGGM